MIAAGSVFFRTTYFIDAAYIVAFSLLIYGMSGLTGPRTAVRGNQIAAAGMAVAVVATLLTPGVWEGTSTVILIIVGVVIGTAIGIPAALKVRMTAMPQMVAIFNGVGGGAVALIAWVEFRHHFAPGYFPLRSEIFELFGAIVGSISFWGSNIAFGKLQEILPGRPIKLPGASQTIVNLALFAIAVASAIILCAGSHSEVLFIVGILVVSAILGNMVVLPIGGADMPVVISLLNAFTGLSAAATGVALNNTVMIVAGMIVGASGTILTNLMAKAMNRSVPAIVAGGFGGAVAAPAGGAGDLEGRTVRSTSAQDVAIQLSYARQVVIAPGYGMAVAQAQHAVRELERALEAKGVTVKYAIHPVAGRMPGHMNVLLAEADVPYDLLREMDDINPEFPRTDVTLVIGANDVTNPAAEREPGSPIYGMPILEVDRSSAVILCAGSHSEALFIVGILVVSAILGNLVVLPIGGADMPVVISLLNAFTGLSAAATGVALNNTVMIVAGMIVGASGTILTNLMAKAMNRSVPAIVAGGFGGAVAAPAGDAAGLEGRTVRSTSAQDVAIQLAYARQVVIAPGYGMAVAQAQHAVRELERALEAKGVTVKYAIHPVAGRMPGHMNVLLAEADVPYDLLREMDDINPEFPRTDVTLVIGANDVTNPAAQNEPGSPIYGMPILEVDRSSAVIVLKRSMASGFAGIDNPLFYEPKTAMLFGDAKASVSEVTSEVQAL